MNSVGFRSIVGFGIYGYRVWDVGKSFREGIMYGRMSFMGQQLGLYFYNMG